MITVLLLLLVTIGLLYITYYPKKTINNIFTPSRTFQGHKAGWVFKLGFNGLGYYLDDKYT